MALRSILSTVARTSIRQRPMISTSSKSTASIRNSTLLSRVSIAGIIGSAATATTSIASSNFVLCEEAQSEEEKLRELMASLAEIYEERELLMMDQQMLDDQLKQTKKRQQKLESML